MIKVNHIQSEQVSQMVGSELGMQLWQTGMMNETRRYPNEIPCSPGEIPSMLIPKSSGWDKVEWGFTAGMSCLVPRAKGKVEIRNAEHFPSSAVLALLSLWYEAGVTKGKRITTTLYIPGNATEFTALLDKAAAKLANLRLIKETLPPAAKAEPASRKACSISNSISVCSGLQGVDVGRFQLTAKCITGEFRPGDNVTLTDGSFEVKAEHCPILGLSDMSGRDIPSTDAVGDDPFGAYIAAWFPADTVFEGLMIIKEVPCPSFSPANMPGKVDIAGADEPVGRNVAESAGSRGQTGPDVDYDAVNASPSIDLSLDADGKDSYPKATEAEMIRIFAEYFSPNTSFYSTPGSPAYRTYFEAIERARQEVFRNMDIFSMATKWSAEELVNLLNNPKPGVTNMVLLGLIFRIGWYCVVKDRLYCVDFSEDVPNCVALYLLLIAQRKPEAQRKQEIDAGDGTDTGYLQRAINEIKKLDPKWNPVILKL